MKIKFWKIDLQMSEFTIMAGILSLAFLGVLGAIVMVATSPACVCL